MSDGVSLSAPECCYYAMQDVLPAAVFLNGARCQVLLDNNLNTPIKLTGTSAQNLGGASSSVGLDAASDKSGSRRRALQTSGRIQAIDGQLYGVDGLPLTINVGPHVVHLSSAGVMSVAGQHGSEFPATRKATECDKAVEAS